MLLAPATGHYSWPKAATLLGLGQNAVLVQRVTRDARLDLEHVETTLFELLRRRVPLLCAVAVIGSTEESAVDPLAGLLALRERFRGYGLNFAIHADAAWGGYFRSMLREDARRGRGRGVPTLADQRLRPHAIRGAGPSRQHHGRSAQERLRALPRWRIVLPQRRHSGTRCRCKHRSCSTARRSRQWASTASKAPSPARRRRRCGWRTG